MMRSVKHTSGATDAQLRRYVLDAYCSRFAREEWVYADGALSIDAQLWLVSGGQEQCRMIDPAGRTTTTPCVHTEVPRVIDCGMLHYVRRSEVRAYTATLENQANVTCDDHTPLAKLGVP
jgi:hypothetical protein